MTAAELPALGAILPELILAVGRAGAADGRRLSPASVRAPAVNALAIVVLALAAIAVMTSDERRPDLERRLPGRRLRAFLKVAALIGSAVAIVLAWRFARAEEFESFEFPVLVVLATLGMLVMISANDLISLYLGLELSALASYVVAAIHRDDARSSEAGLKYFVLGALSSGMLLYGASLVYGFTGHTGFEPIAAALVEGRSLGLVVGLVFVLAGLAFKISAVPFHMWTPDVYEGAPTPVTAFFASAPKLAALALIVRVVIDAFAPITTDWQQIITFVSIASMALGAFAAIGQTNIKRLMAYSSIGHMGYALVGLAAGSEQGVQGVIVYAVIYMAMTLGTFAAILAMRRNGDDGGGDRLARGAGANQAGDGVPARHAALLARRHSAARRLLREVLRVPRRHPVRPLCARRDRRRRQRGRRLLLSADRQDHVFRRAGGRLRAGAGRAWSGARDFGRAGACLRADRLAAGRGGGRRRA